MVKTLNIWVNSARWVEPGKEIPPPIEYTYKEWNDVKIVWDLLVVNGHWERFCSFVYSKWLETMNLYKDIPEPYKDLNPNLTRWLFTHSTSGIYRFCEFVAEYIEKEKMLYYK